MLRGNKRGQFFLLAAVIIISGIVAIASIKTFVSETGTKTQEKIYDLSKELGYESVKVIDFGIFNQTYGEELMDDWIGRYTNYSKDKDEITEWLFVYGNTSKIIITNFTQETQGDIDLSLGDKKVTTKSKPKLISKKDTRENLIAGTNGKYIVIVTDTLGIQRKFELKSGENFYFVVAKADRGEVIIQKNDE